MKIVATISLILGLMILIIFSYLIIINGYINPSHEFSLDNSVKIAPFIGSCVGVFFSLTGTLLVIENLKVTNSNNAMNALLAQKSQFESVFFGLLNQQRQIRDSINSSVYSHYYEKEIEESGAGFFDDLATFLTIEFKDKTQNLEELIKLYNLHFPMYNSDLGHYFRHLYHIVKYVDSNYYFTMITGDIRFIQQKDYIKMLRAQLSNPEITLLAINGLTVQGAGFKNFIDKYELLVNINLETDMPENYQSRVPNHTVWIRQYSCLNDLKS